jgi:hypothetical protein
MGIPNAEEEDQEQGPLYSLFHDVLKICPKIGKFPEGRTQSGRSLDILRQRAK